MNESGIKTGARIISTFVRGAKIPTTTTRAWTRQSLNSFDENWASFSKNIVWCSRACRCVVWCVWALRKRFRKKYVYPPPLSFPDTGISQERNKSASQGTTQQYNSMQSPWQCCECAPSTNVIVCSVRDEILFMYLQLSALCYRYLSFALFMHFSSDFRNIFLFCFCVCSRPGGKWNEYKKNVSSSKFVLPLTCCVVI